MENTWGYEIDFPQDVMYSPELLWLKEIEGEKLRLGMSHLAVRAAKRLLSIDIASRKGIRLKQGDRIGSVENTKVRWEIKSPVSGEVVGINPEMFAGKATATIMKDAYGAGWLLELKKLSETDGELRQLHKGGTPGTDLWLDAQTKAIVPLADASDYGME